MENQKIKISDFPLVSITESHLKNSEDCTICLECFSKSDEVVGLPCFHLFHKKCLFDWFQMKFKCPTCQQNPCEITLPNDLSLLKDVPKSLRALSYSWKEDNKEKVEIYKILVESFTNIPYDVLFSTNNNGKHSYSSVLTRIKKKQDPFPPLSSVTKKEKSANSISFHPSKIHKIQNYSTILSNSKLKEINAMQSPDKKSCHFTSNSNSSDFLVKFPSHLKSLDFSSNQKLSPFEIQPNCICNQVPTSSQLRYSDVVSLKISKSSEEQFVDNFKELNYNIKKKKNKISQNNKKPLNLNSDETRNSFEAEEDFPALFPSKNAQIFNSSKICSDSLSENISSTKSIQSFSSVLCFKTLSSNLQTSNKESFENFPQLPTSLSNQSKDLSIFSKEKLCFSNILKSSSKQKSFH